MLFCPCRYVASVNQALYSTELPCFWPAMLVETDWKTKSTFTLVLTISRSYGRSLLCNPKYRWKPQRETIHTTWAIPWKNLQWQRRCNYKNDTVLFGQQQRPRVQRATSFSGGREGILGTRLRKKRSSDFTICEGHSRLSWWMFDQKR